MSQAAISYQLRVRLGCMGRGGSFQSSGNGIRGTSWKFTRVSSYSLRLGVIHRPNSDPDRRILPTPPGSSRSRRSSRLESDAPSQPETDLTPKPSVHRRSPPSSPVTIPTPSSTIHGGSQIDLAAISPLSSLLALTPQAADLSHSMLHLSDDDGDTDEPITPVEFLPSVEKRGEMRLGGGTSVGGSSVDEEVRTPPLVGMTGLGLDLWAGAEEKGAGPRRRGESGRYVRTLSLELETVL